MRRRRLRRPVLSRLTWAWLFALGACLCLGAGLFHLASKREGAGRIALPVEQLEVFARAETPPAQMPVAQNSAPALRDGAPAKSPGARYADTMESDEPGETLALIYPGEDAMFADDEMADDEYAYADDDFGGDVIITIPGHTSAVRAATAASLQEPARKIPDPLPDLLRKTALGETPRIAPDGRKAVHVYARQAEPAPGKARIGILVGGLGLNAAVTERAIDELPPDISLSFAPYAKNLDFWTKKARDAGHEVLIELPMEGYGGNAQALGAAALLSSRTEKENAQRLEWLMARFGAYVAATNYMGAKFSADTQALGPVLAQLQSYGVGYVDDTGAAARAGSGVAMATVSRMIPSAADPEDLRMVKRELAALEAIAQQDGQAVGKTYAYAATIDELASWSRSLEQKNLAVTPVSSLLQSNSAAR